MLARIPAPIRIPLVLLVLLASTLVHVALLLLATLAKALLPGMGARRRTGRVLEVIAESWIGVNSAMIDRFTDTRVQVEGLEGLDRRRSYLVLSNHQSWVDIPLLQKVLNRRIPLLRFFLKRQLIWVPVLGLAWWALDFPFMHRHSREQIAADPALARRDLEATRRACERFRGNPVAVMNFVEGTRATPAKLAAQRQAGDGVQPGYRYLLRPKAGGVAFVLGALADVLDEILDVTVIYPEGPATLWQLLANRLPAVRIVIKRVPLPSDLIAGDYASDPVLRDRFQRWLNGLWSAKDSEISNYKNR